MISKKRIKNRKKDNTISIQILPEGIVMVVRELFHDGWIPEEPTVRIIDLYQQGKGWESKDFQDAFAVVKPYIHASSEANNAATRALSQKLGRLLEEDDVNSIEYPKGPYFADNQRLLARLN